jgi:hypothetical protein
MADLMNSLMLIKYFLTPLKQLIWNWLSFPIETVIQFSIDFPPILVVVPAVQNNRKLSINLVIEKCKDLLA